MAKPRVVIKEVAPDVAAQIANDMADRTFAPPASAEPFEPHITDGATAALTLKPARPLPPKPTERPRTFDDN
jgi:hypothetical protein